MRPSTCFSCPRKHIRSINDLAEDDGPIVGAMIMRARALARTLRVDRSGYKLQFNVERGAGQVIFHLHMHLVGGWRLDTGDAGRRPGASGPFYGTISPGSCRQR